MSKSIEEKVGTILEESMTNAVQMEVKFEVQKSSAYNWYDLK